MSGCPDECQHGHLNQNTMSSALNVTDKVVGHILLLTNGRGLSVGINLLIIINGLCVLEGESSRSQYLEAGQDEP